MSPRRYAAVLVAFAAQRGFELAYSARNERTIRRRQPGAPQAAESIFKWIALVNAGLFTLPVLERWLRRRPAPPLVAGFGWVAALSGVALRLSVLLSLRSSWNVHAVVPDNLRVVDIGPYRFIRHPNYVALGLEFLGLPLIGGAYVRVFNDRGSIELRARVTDRARPGVVVGLSVWWKKLARDGKNANELTSSDTLTDMGRAPTFYDCLVQVEALAIP